MNDIFSVNFSHNQWDGKTVCFLGDSITDGVGVGKGERYFDLLPAMTGIKAYGYGVNGAQSINLLDQIKRMKDEHGADVDAIFVFIGTNDYNSSVPLGDWFVMSEAEVVTARDADGNTVSSETRPKRDLSFDRDTFRGRMNIVMAELRHSYPHSTILLMTPIHRGYACFGQTNIQFPENYSNHLGLFVDSYVNVVREAADVWATELIELHRVSGLFPCFDESADDFANVDHDRLHPGKRGHERMARAIAAKMRCIAVK